MKIEDFDILFPYQAGMIKNDIYRLDNLVKNADEENKEDIEVIIDDLINALNEIKCNLKKE